MKSPNLAMTISNRIQISKSAGSAEIRIRMRKSAVRIGFLVIWLPLIALGGTAVTTSLIIGAIPRTAVQVVVQLLWGAVVTYGLIALLWTLFGEELVSLGKETFIHRRQILGFGVTRCIPLKEVSNCHVASDSQSDFWGLTGGMLVVNRDGREYRFGIELSQTEAASLLGQLAEYVPTSV